MNHDAGPATPTVSVVVVSYNTRLMTLDCLRALYADLGGTAAEVFLVDNGSADGSPAAVAAAFPAATVIDMGRNAGFGAANNAAFGRAAGTFLLLLNSDAFLHAGAVGAMLACMGRHPRAAAVGPRLVNGDGSLQPSCFRFPTPGQAWRENLFLTRLVRPASPLGDYQRWPHDAEREVDWAVGACLLVRRSAYERVGGFDERFFLYAEETDWQRRMRDAGGTVVFTPAAVVTHRGGASGGGDVNGHFFDGLDRYGRKHHGPAGVVAVRAAMVVGCFARLWLWAGVWLGGISRAGRRARAAGKVKLMAWLCVRQLTHRGPAGTR